MEQTFGSYVREKRMARGLSLRALGSKAGGVSGLYEQHRK